AIWTNKNQLVNERKQFNGKEIGEWVARNASAEIVASKMVFYIEVASPFTAEGHACLQVLLLGIQLRFRAMVVEGDARTIIKKISANTLAHVLATKTLKRDKEDYLEGLKPWEEEDEENLTEGGCCGRLWKG
ncbi:hypothetical protein Goari_022392, partial [Gossypium aridum]|nr:hypothetical protein [Gossypium aridum]